MNGPKLKLIQKLKKSVAGSDSNLEISKSSMLKDSITERNKPMLKQNRRILLIDLTKV